LFSLFLGIFLCVTCPIKRTGILLSITFVLGTEMKKHLNRNKKKNKTKVAAAKVFSLATILVVAAIGLTTTAPLTALAISTAQLAPQRSVTAAPSVVTGENVYIAWWNGTAGLPDVQTDVMFRASTDGGATFSDRINLSNTTDADSWRVEIAGEGETVVVSWWETNQTSDIPVARISTDAGETFGPILMLGANGTISTTAAAEGVEEEAAAAADEGGE
jgi:hypothetical protein